MITREFGAQLLKIGEKRVSIPVQVELGYDEDFDPLAAIMVISVEGESDVAWVVARELLVAGNGSPVKIGDGDVRFRRQDEYLMVCLGNLTGHADLAFPGQEVSHFLRETTKAVPLGAERLDGLLDDVIKEILSS